MTFVPQPLLPASMCFPSGLPDVKGSLCQVLGFFSEENFPYIAVDSKCPWEKVNSQTSHSTILSQNSAFAFRRDFIFWPLPAKGRSESPDDVTFLSISLGCLEVSPLAP